MGQGYLLSNNNNKIRLMQKLYQSMQFAKKSDNHTYTSFLLSWDSTKWCLLRQNSKLVLYLGKVEKRTATKEHKSNSQFRKFLGPLVPGTLFLPPELAELALFSLMLAVERSPVG